MSNGCRTLDMESEFNERMRQWHETYDPSPVEGAPNA